MIGETLGHYRIEAQLGAGGMGVVYRALDTHLSRPAAVKVLPAAALENPERRARFAQEAKSASALSHRNIVTIYSIDTATVDGRATDYIAMEYVEGKTLDKLIGRKGLPADTALRYAAQVASGLAAAHEAGIIHRDLKPANVIVSAQGEVKILDFGLAKLTEREPDAFAATESVHLKTEVDTILGTVAYMSPEQAEGHSVDARSDIFSFGAMLYEMVTGRRAFPGDSKLSTLASLLHREPAPLAGTDVAVPGEVERIIMRCLRKDPQRRWQSMADLKVALEDALADLDSPQPAAAPVLKRRRPIPVFLWFALTALAMAAGAYVGGRTLSEPQPSFQRLTYRRGNVAGARFAPDGTVLFSAQWAADPTTLFSMRPGSGESRTLGLPEARVLSVSSSGEMAMLLGSTARGVPGTLARVPLSGGAPREILENVNDADWSPDGTQLAVCHTVGGKNQIEYPIGTVLAESRGRPPLSLRVSPKGDLLAYFEYDNAVGDFALTLVDLHKKKRVLSRGWRREDGLAWKPGGNEIWYSGTKTGGEPALHAVRMNGADRIVLEAPAAMSLQDISADGRVLAAVEDSRLGIIAKAPGADSERELSWFDASRIYDVSNDGKTILFVELSYGKQRNPAIYVRGTDGAPAVRLGDGNRPALSPDGKWVATIVNEGLKTTIAILPTGPGQARTIEGGGMHYERLEWFPDGKRLLFAGNEPGHPVRIFQQDVNGGKPIPVTPEGMDATRVSPDCKWVTAASGGTLTLFPIGPGQPKPVAALERGESVIRWSADGRSVFLRRAMDAALVRISRLDIDGGRRALFRELRPADSVGVQIGQVVMTPDGDSYAYSFQRDSSTLYLSSNLK